MLRLSRHFLSCILSLLLVATVTEGARAPWDVGTSTPSFSRKSSFVIPGARPTSGTTLVSGSFPVTKFSAGYSHGTMLALRGGEDAVVAPENKSSMMTSGFNLIKMLMFVPLFWFRYFPDSFPLTAVPDATQTTLHLAFVGMFLLLINLCPQLRTFHHAAMLLLIEFDIYHLAMNACWFVITLSALMEITPSPEGEGEETGGTRNLSSYKFFVLFYGMKKLATWYMQKQN